MIDLIKKNYRRFVFSMAVNAVLFIIFNVFFYCRYNAVDDTFMTMFVSGAYGTPDPHMIYTNVIIGWILSTLYRICHGINWYGLLQIFFVFLSMSALTYVFLNRKNRYIGILALLPVIFASYEGYTKVQFTKTAAYLAIAGYLLIAYSFELINSNQKQVFGIAFLVCGYMVRTGMFLGVSAVCLGCLIPIVFRWLKDLKNENNKKDLIRLLSIGGISLLLVIGVSFVDALAYRTDGWMFYKHFNEYTTQFEDIYFPPYDRFEKEYTELGLNKEDVSMYKNVDHNDPDVFTFEVMDKVRRLQSHKTIDLNELVMFLIKGRHTLFQHRTMSTFTFMTIYMMLIFVFSKPGKTKRFAFLYTGFAAIILLLYSYIMHEWLDRTTISTLLSVIFVLLYLSEPKQGNITKTAVIFAIITSVFLCFRAYRNYFKWKMQYWIDEYDVNHEVLDEIYADKEHLYMSRTALPVWKVYYTPYDVIRTGAMDNYSTLGDWIANTPLYLEVLSDYGVRNPFKDLVNNDKAYFIGYEKDMGKVLSYIQRHHYEDAEAILVRESGPYRVYSIVTK